MTALAGGAADKIGNRYEHWWTARRIADLLEGKIRSIRLEPPGPAGQGVEFVLEDTDGYVGEQVKSTSTTWTLHQLEIQKVLAAIAVQLRLGRSFRLVTTVAAERFSTLTDRARAAQTLGELEVMLGARSGDLDVVRRAWGEVDRGTCWGMLRRVHVEEHPADSLRPMTESRWERLYTGDPTVVMSTLRAFCEDRLHQTITAPQIRSHLADRGFRPALLVGDGDALRRLADTVAAQRRAVEVVAPSRGRVPRSISADVFAELGEDGCRVLVLDGDAGTGKSVVAAEVARLAEAAGWFVAATRLDGIDPSVRTSPALGRAMDLAGCPVTMLAGVSGGDPSLLVIDQLDAVSTHSGRMPDTFLAVADALDRARGAPALRVLLVVRSVDLRSDPRLSGLLDRYHVARWSVGLLSDEDVEAFLGGEAFVSLDAVTRELLRTPLHLAVHLRMPEAGVSSYRTITDLYDAYTEQVRRHLDARPRDCDTRGIIGALVRAMNENETLTAPEYVLDALRPADVGAVESQGLIVFDGARKSVRFFHETYLDHVFARWFLGEGRDLHDHLAASGQALFQRAPVRQVLTLLAATDRPRFWSAVARLLTSTQIRSHLKMLVVDLLIAVDPQPEDWERIEPLAWCDDHLGRRVRSLLSHPRWFDAADGLGRWQRWLADEATVDHVFHQLALVGQARPERTEALVRPHLGSSPQWRYRIRHLLDWSLSPGLVHLAVEVMTDGGYDEEGGVTPCVSAAPLTTVMVEDGSAVTLPLLGAWLRRGTALARSTGSSNPFEAGTLAQDPGVESVVHELVDAAPAGFVTEVLPTVVQVALSDQRERGGLLPTGPLGRSRYVGTTHGLDQVLFQGLDAALRRLALEHPARCDGALEGLRVLESDELRFLVCRALTIRGDADAALGWLLSDQRHLHLGWSDSPWWASRDLVAAWSASCSPSVFDALERAILDHRSPFERPERAGEGQYVLLSGLAQARLSPAGRERLAVLAQRHPRSLRGPRSITAHFVGSPIAEDVSAGMSDDQWLAALREHDDEGLRFDEDDRRIGGARELAMQLGRRAEENPERFAWLALRLDASTPSSAIDQVIQAVAGVDPHLLADLCEQALRDHGPAVARSVCWAVQQSGESTERLVHLVVTCAEDPDPEGDAVLLERQGEDLLSAGMNCTRGGAAMAAASVLSAGDAHVETLVPVVARLATDAVPAVRAVAADAVTALLDHDQERALAIALELVGGPSPVLDSETVERLLCHAVLRDPERFVPVVRRALVEPGGVGRRAGRVWAVAVLYGSSQSGLPTSAVELCPDARRGAAEALASDPGRRLDLLLPLLDDQDDDVGTAATTAVRHVEELVADDADNLVEGVLASRAADDALPAVVDVLESSPRPLLRSTVEVCEMAARAVGREGADIRTARAALARATVSLTLRQYRAGDESVRSRCLDVIDRLSEVGAYGLDRALEDER